MASKPKNLKKKLANPGERSKLPAKYLTSAQRNQRAMNARLAQPIANVPGTGLTSPLTERDLAHEAQAATSVRYGPQEQAIAQQLAQAVQQRNDTQSWYDDYKTRLQSYQQQVGAYQQGAQDAMAHLQAGVTGLGQQDQSFVQAQQQGQPAGTNTVSTVPTANAALAVRQGIAGNFGVNQANVGAANNTYASNLANVVGPQQQLTALAGKQGQISKVQQARTDLRGQEGAYNQQYRANRRSDETKNLLAAGALGVNQTNATTAQTRADTSAKQNSPEGKAAAASATSEARVAANHGYSLHDWRMLGPDARAAKIAADKKAGGAGKGADKVISSGPYAGYTQAELQAMTPAQRQKLADKGNKSTGPKLTTAQQNTGMTQLPNLKEYLSRARSGKAFVEGHPRQAPLGRAGAVAKVRNSTKKLVSDALLGAAADAVYDGHISSVTAQRLREAGFDPARVAKELGVPLGRPGSKIPLNKK